MTRSDPRPAAPADRLRAADCSGSREGSQVRRLVLEPRPARVLLSPSRQRGRHGHGLIGMATELGDLRPSTALVQATSATPQRESDLFSSEGRNSDPASRFEPVLHPARGALLVGPATLAPPGIDQSQPPPRQSRLEDRETAGPADVAPGVAEADLSPSATGHELRMAWKRRRVASSSRGRRRTGRPADVRPHRRTRPPRMCSRSPPSARAQPAGRRAAVSPVRRSPIGDGPWQVDRPVSGVEPFRRRADGVMGRPVVVAHRDLQRGRLRWSLVGGSGRDGVGE
ncbi:hypothetical protein LY71_12510 [Geodermatophilus tzadiensis]|uniref:Uncharacterized protein n=1 Tax=Geodermatophilus tzadiensis TaxID=1137988 RepID=A0A2T0ST52_9ACTN|nr:hypothetical protein LY71_12510 [Geodermatophilus tzadiensis]